LCDSKALFLALIATIAPRSHTFIHKEQRFKSEDNLSQDLVILQLINIRDPIPAYNVQEHDTQNHLTIQPAMRTSAITKAMVKDLLIIQNLQRQKDTTIECCVLFGDKLGLDRKSILRYHNVHPLG